MLGKDIQELPPSKRKFNMVFQNYALFPHMTVFENVAFGLRMKGYPNTQIEEEVFKALKIFKMKNLADRKPSQLSGGQQQRVAMARAIVNRPKILLFDEPLSALDYKLRKEMQVELKRLQRELGITFVLVTHDQEEALSMSDRIVVMQDGAIAQSGTPTEIYERPASLFVANFIGEANIFAGKVLSTSDTSLDVEIEGGKFALNRGTLNLSPGDDIHMILRPEDIRILKIKNPRKKLTGKLIDIIYKGKTMDFFIELPSKKQIMVTEFFNENDPMANFVSGEIVGLRWIDDWETVLPNES
jgi:spermidine/putrescine transport system ATP-binding protein